MGKHEGEISRDESSEQFIAFISEETEKARLEVVEWIADPSVTDIGCVDKLTQKGHRNPPGGVAFLYGEGLLEDFVANRQATQNAGTLMAHLNCGYLFIRGLQTVETQQDAITEIRENVHALNEKYGTQFTVPEPEPIGSAAPFMKSSPLQP